MTPTERQTVIQALEAVDALIDHQFTGTRAGMTALQHACDDCREALGIMRREWIACGACVTPIGCKRDNRCFCPGAPALRED